MSDERPSHGQLLRVVHRWCCQHDAEMLSLGLEQRESGPTWRAEVRLAGGQRAVAFGVDQTELVAGLDLTLRVDVLN